MFSFLGSGRCCPLLGGLLYMTQNSPMNFCEYTPLSPVENRPDAMIIPRSMAMVNLSSVTIKVPKNIPFDRPRITDKRCFLRDAEGDHKDHAAFSAFLGKTTSPHSHTQKVSLSPSRAPYSPKGGPRAVCCGAVSHDIYSRVRLAALPAP
jgi:hypothetical protein